MQKVDTSLPGVFELRPKIFGDARGFFMETYHRTKFADLGIRDTFVQDNHSCSAKGTLRGLHYQLQHPQAKLCRVVEGEALDLVVDIRVGSPQFGKWTSVLLSATIQNQIYLPAGFAHGFLALTNSGVCVESKPLNWVMVVSVIRMPLPVMTKILPLASTGGASPLDHRPAPSEPSAEVQKTVI